MKDPVRKKIVKKPWGSEEWLVHNQSPFVLKLINIKASGRTSLQYHRKKEEANFVLSGSGVLHFRAEGKARITCRQIFPGDVIHIKAGSVHRIEAVENLIIVEVSTPEVEDVVRVEDDYGRQ